MIFIGVQINHPQVDVTTISTTEMVVRMSLKLLTAALARVGLTGMYLRQVRQTGVLGYVNDYSAASTGGLAGAALSMMPDVFYRLLAFPNAIALIALGYSLWRSVRTTTTPEPTPAHGPRVAAAAGVE